MSEWTDIRDVRPGDVVPMVGLVTEVRHDELFTAGDPYLPEATIVGFDGRRWRELTEPFGFAIPGVVPAAGDGSSRTGWPSCRTPVP